MSKETPLVTKLRDLGSCCDPECQGRCRWCPIDVGNDAANEIERLIGKVRDLELKLAKLGGTAKAYG